MLHAEKKVNFWWGIRSQLLLCVSRAVGWVVTSSLVSSLTNWFCILWNSLSCHSRKATNIGKSANFLMGRQVYSRIPHQQAGSRSATEFRGKAPCAFPLSCYPPASLTDDGSQEDRWAPAASRLSSVCSLKAWHLKYVSLWLPFLKIIRGYRCELGKSSYSIWWQSMVLLFIQRKADHRLCQHWPIGCLLQYIHFFQVIVRLLACWVISGFCDQRVSIKLFLVSSVGERFLTFSFILICTENSFSVQWNSYLECIICSPLLLMDPGIGIMASEIQKHCVLQMCG